MCTRRLRQLRAHPIAADQQFFNRGPYRPASFGSRRGDQLHQHACVVNFTPRLGLDYHFTEHVMAYVSYSRASRAVGSTMRGNAAVYPQTQNGYKLGDRG